MKNAVLIFSFSLLFVSCKHKTRSEKLLDEFKKVNESITESNKALEENSYTQNFLLIKLKQSTNPELSKSAENLYEAVDTALHYTEKLREILRSANEDDLCIANKLIEKGANGDTLAILLLDVYDKAYLCPISADKKPALNEGLSGIEIIRTNKDWKKWYFEKSHAIAALTILSKFQNDIKNAAALVMLDMARQLKK